MAKQALPFNKLLSFAGKTVLITGATSGIGKATAIRFAQAGASLQIIARSKPDAEVLAQFSGAKSVHSYQVDLSDPEQITSFWEQLSDHEIPDVLVNNAGIYPIKDLLDIDQAFLEKFMNIDLNSVLWMCQQFIKRRLGLQKEGVIVNTSSIEALLPTTSNLAHYGAAKAGVVGLTRAIARDYGRKGIRANVITPGGILTEGTQATGKEALLHLRFNLLKTGYDFSQRLALGHLGDPDDVAKVTLFLASDMASYMTGAIVPVDGGFLSS